MESGVVGEFGEVPTLMARPGSSFRAMVVEAGLEGAASASVSRAASRAQLSQLAEEEEAAEGGAGVPLPSDSDSSVAAVSGAAGGRRMEGLPTFINRMKLDYDLK